MNVWSLPIGEASAMKVLRLQPAQQACLNPHKASIVILFEFDKYPAGLFEREKIPELIYLVLLSFLIEKNIFLIQW